MNLNRLATLKNGDEFSGPVIYWMQRDQRVHDNWALIYAQEKALEKNVQLIVVFNLVSNFLEATIRQYGFMIKGLQETEAELRKYNIPFILTNGKPEEELPKIITSYKASLLVTDFNPLKIIQGWKKSVAKKIKISFHEVDTHNIVSCFHASGKQEFAAYTIRPKINKLLPDYLEQFPPVKKMKGRLSSKKINWERVIKNLAVNREVKEIDWLVPGSIAAHKILKKFISEKLQSYNEKRNDPSMDAISNLSPYLHFGQISAQRIALELQPFIENYKSVYSFLEELIVRKELSDNFCYYNENYDLFKGFPKWAQETLDLHRKDKREYIYLLKQFESANTHDELWNAAQQEMVTKGKMHGYLRMYWAKKILEWTKSPEDAIRIAIYLNDKYELDGRDPNGYTGIAWSIGGVHDRAWSERNIFGKIRFMNYNGCKRKFDVNKYIEKLSRPKKG